MEIFLRPWNYPWRISRELLLIGHTGKIFTRIISFYFGLRKAFWRWTPCRFRYAVRQWLYVGAFNSRNCYFAEVRPNSDYLLFYWWFAYDISFFLGRIMKDLKYILPGVLFGIILTKSQVISWFRINDMFRFKELHMYLIISSAIAVALAAYLLIKKFKVNDISGNKIAIAEKEMNKGVIIGGVIFGLGWAITGACPGPIFAQIGGGELPAVFTLIGAITGAYLYSRLKSKLPH